MTWHRFLFPTDHATPKKESVDKSPHSKGFGLQHTATNSEEDFYGNS
jgi:hypothetical protein